MPASKSVNKAARTAEKKRLRNRLVRSRTRAYMSRARGLIGAGQLELAQQEAVVAISNIDRAVSRGVFHKNKAARLKSRLMKKLNALAAVSQIPEQKEKEAEQS
ncbi:MAG: 30S ribosomal protein S20 [Dehalococcoidia bacterium]|nr:30S ribosomal protein S20 [Dehalococcoidia bacterium]